MSAQASGQRAMSEDSEDPVAAGERPEARAVALDERIVEETAVPTGSDTEKVAGPGRLRRAGAVIGASFGTAFRAARRGVAGVIRICRARPRLFLASWAVMLALLTAGVGMMWWFDRQHDTAREASAVVLEAADTDISEVLSYQAATIDDDLQRARAHLTGDFADEFTRLTNDLIVPTAKQDAITTRAEVTAKSVVDAQPDRVVTLLFITQTTTGSAFPEPKVDGSRVQVTFVDVDGRWLIQDLVPL